MELCIRQTRNLYTPQFRDMMLHQSLLLEQDLEAEHPSQNQDFYLESSPRYYYYRGVPGSTPCPRNPQVCSLWVSLVRYVSLDSFLLGGQRGLEGVGLVAHHQKLRGSYAIDILDSLEKTLKKPNFERFCTKMWGVWKDRCTLAHNPKARARTKDTPQLGQWTDGFLHEFQKSQK